MRASLYLIGQRENQNAEARRKEGTEAEQLDGTGIVQPETHHPGVGFRHQFTY